MNWQTQLGRSPAASCLVSETPLVIRPLCTSPQCPAGVEHPADFAGKPGISQPGGAESDAPGGDLASIRQPADSDLAAVVKAWPDLPPAIRAGILAMIQAAQGGA